MSGIVTSVDVCEAIGGVIAKLWPERVLYRDFCPADHHRPSGFLYVTRSGWEPLTPGLCRWEMEASLELFCATDHYDVSSTEALRRDQEQVLLAFAPQVLEVGDRHIGLQVRGEGGEAGSAFVAFSASWYDQIPSYADLEDPDAPGQPADPEHPDGPWEGRPPLMEDYQLDLTERTE